MNMSAINRASQRLQQIKRSVSLPLKNYTEIRMSSTSITGSGGHEEEGSHLPTRHLASGDDLPPQRKDTLRLFSMKYCPFASRPRLVLAAKGIPYETINCNLMNKPEFLLERNPEGQVPVLEWQGRVVCESTIICDLLEEMYPQRPLYPTDPFSKARDKLTIYFFNTKVVNLLYKIYRYKDDDPELHTKFLDALRKMEEDLTTRGTTFFSGRNPGMIDYMCWPWFERVVWLDQSTNYNGGILSKFPTLKIYVENMHGEDAVKATYIPPEEFDRFYQGMFSGNPVYDL